MRTYTFRLKDRDGNVKTVEITAVDLKSALKQLRHQYPHHMYQA